MREFDEKEIEVTAEEQITLNDLEQAVVNFQGNSLKLTTPTKDGIGNRSATVISTNLIQNHTLEHFSADFSETALGNEGLTILLNIATLPNIRTFSLDISDTFINDINPLINSFQRGANITELYIRSNNGLNATAFENLFRSITNTNLKTLDVANNDLNDTSVSYLLDTIESRTASLQSLSLGQLELSEENQLRLINCLYVSELVEFQLYTVNSLERAINLLDFLLHNRTHYNYEIDSLNFAAGFADTILGNNENNISTFKTNYRNISEGMDIDKILTNISEVRDFVLLLRKHESFSEEFSLMLKKVKGLVNENIFDLLHKDVTYGLLPLSKPIAGLIIEYTDYDIDLFNWAEKMEFAIAQSRQI